MDDLDDGRDDDRAVVPRQPRSLEVEDLAVVKPVAKGAMTFVSNHRLERARQRFFSHAESVNAGVLAA